MKRFFAVLVAVGVLASPGCKKEEPAPATGKAGGAPAVEPSKAGPGEAKPVEGAEAPKPTVDLTKVREAAKSFAVLPGGFGEVRPADDPVVALGKQLYFDPRLSKNHDVSCNTCHDLEKYGVDGLQFSKGHKGQLGGRNAPTVLNAAGQFVQFWDGRAKDVEEQAKGPMMNPVEMAMTDGDLVERTLRSIPGYVDAFAKAFPGQEQSVTLDNAAVAIGAFERLLATPSKWDRFLGGDDSALTAAEVHGFETFVEVGCGSCHDGALVGGASYQQLGMVEDWPKQDDLGRFAVTKAEGDKLQFKVPTLRNIDKTGPYLHDGATAKLEDAVRLMAKHQLGQELDDAKVGAIMAWLATLTGELPKDLAAKPTLPESGPETPAPDPT